MNEDGSGGKRCSQQTKLVARCAWLTCGDTQHAWYPIDALGARRSLCGCRIHRLDLSRQKRQRCLLCIHMKSADFRIAPRSHDEVARTALHEIRSVREQVGQAIDELRKTSVTPKSRADILSNLVAIDGQLLHLYRRERAGRNKKYYDNMLREDSSGPG